MRSNEDRIAAMHKRAAKYRKYRTIQIMSIGTAFVLAVIASLYIPAIADTGSFVTAYESMTASIFSNGNALLLFVIAIVAFLLGASVTIFCFYLKRWYERMD